MQFLHPKEWWLAPLYASHFGCGPSKNKYAFPPPFLHLFFFAVFAPTLAYLFLEDEQVEHQFTPSLVFRSLTYHHHLIALKTR
jgi:hypothetical protein